MKTAKHRQKALSKNQILVACLISAAWSSGIHNTAHADTGGQNTIIANANSSGSTTTIFVCAGQSAFGGTSSVLADYDQSTGVYETKYVYGGYIDEPIAQIDASGDTLYYHRDRRYNVVAISDEAGQIQQRYAYDASVVKLKNSKFENNLDRI